MEKNENMEKNVERKDVMALKVKNEKVKNELKRQAPPHQQLLLLERTKSILENLPNLEVKK